MSQQRSVGLVMEGAVITHKYLGAGEALFSSVSAHSLAGRSGPRVLSARRERDFEEEQGGQGHWLCSTTGSPSQPCFPDCSFYECSQGSGVDILRGWRVCRDGGPTVRKLGFPRLLKWLRNLVSGRGISPDLPGRADFPGGFLGVNFQGQHPSSTDSFYCHGDRLLLSPVRSLSCRHHDNLWGLEAQLQSTSETRARTEVQGHYDCHRLS